MRPTHPSELFPELTNREREILSLIAQHLSNADIAARLSLNEKTVRNHVSNIFTPLSACLSPPLNHYYP